MSLDGDLSPSLATSKKPVAALSGAGNYSFWAPGVWGQVENRMLDAVGSLGASRGKDPALAGARAVTFQSHRLRQQLSQFDSDITSPVPYPKSESRFPDQMAGLAAMLASGLPLHCVALSAYGMYDTHSDQAEDLANGLKLTSDTLLAFQRDLEARGLANRVLTLVWSEFGRRAEENGSDGTDHGAAGIGLLMGTRVRGNMIGEFPGLRNGLDDNGNLKATVDYRSVYCSVLEQWLSTDAAAVIPQGQVLRKGAPTAMRRAGLLLIGFAFAGSMPAQAAAPLSRVQVVAVEFNYRLSRVRIPAGPVRIELANFGQDEHDLRLRRIGGKKVYKLPSALPGERHTLSARLQPGLYRLKCTLADHAERGMRAELRVRPRT